MYKIFAKLLLQNATRYVEDANKILNPLQFGGRKNVSMSQALLTFQSVVEDANHWDKDLHSLSIDFNKAYDSVDHWIPKWFRWLQT